MTPADFPARSPLGQSYLLVPAPNEDESLLGRVLVDGAGDGRSLQDISRPNECADKLAPKKEGPLASSFDDSLELAAGGKARPVVKAFGFEGDLPAATHFHYKLDAGKQVSQSATEDYAACCKSKGTCGYGFVSALIYGAGEYATMQEANADGSVPIAVAGAGAGSYVRAKILHKREVHGYVAALVTVTDEARSIPFGIMGDKAATGLAETDVPDSEKEVYDANKLFISDVKDEMNYTIRDGRGEAITENEFVRRYREYLGDELNEYETNHALGARVAWGTALAVALGVVVGGLAITVSNPGMCSQSQLTTGSGDNSTCGLGPSGVVGAVVAGAGFLGAVGGGVGLVLSFAKGTYDGTPASHRLGQRQAQAYIVRYNRALLRKTVHDQDSQDSASLPAPRSPRITLAPVVSPGFTGIVAQF